MYCNLRHLNSKWKWYLQLRIGFGIIVIMNNYLFLHNYKNLQNAQFCIFVLKILKHIKGVSFFWGQFVFLMIKHTIVVQYWMSIELHSNCGSIEHCCVATSKQVHNIAQMVNDNEMIMKGTWQVGLMKCFIQFQLIWLCELATSSWCEIVFIVTITIDWHCCKSL
jgi:hypothetical protein